MRRAFTIVELLVVTAIIALLLGVLLPAIGKARDAALVTASAANLRNIAVAHQSYAAEWNDRQLTFVDDNMSHYGHDYTAWGQAGYWGARGGRDTAHQHPPIVFGWAHTDNGYERQELTSGFYQENAALTVPIVFTQGGCSRWDPTYFGSFRLINAEPFHQYVSGRFYDPVFYAPKDTIVTDAAAACFESPDQYCTQAEVRVHNDIFDVPAWSSYVMSPAAMFAPEVFERPGADRRDGFIDPFSRPGGFRSPSFSQALYPSLKTHMLEHHWLQNAPDQPCNWKFEHSVYGTRYGDLECEPYYFNHSAQSSPVTLFYDGHVENVEVARAMRADGLIMAQTRGGMQDRGVGLWCRDTPWGAGGYLNRFAHDETMTSFHILTTDGIRGRDLTTE